MTDTAKVLSILDSQLGSHQNKRHNEYEWPCPFCGNPKNLAINVETGRWHCWICNNGGKKLTSLLWRIKSPKDKIREIGEIFGATTYIPKQTVEPDQLSLPNEMKPMWKESKELEYLHASAYLTNRRITPIDILRYQIGMCSGGKYQGRIIVPSFDADNKLNYFVARAYYESNKFKYLNPPASKNVICFESLISWKYPIVLCEGVFDAMAIRNNAIPLLGKTIPQKLKEKIITENIKDIYLALDADALNDAMRIAISFVEQDRNVYLVNLDGKDPSVAGFEVMCQKIADAKKLSYKDIIKYKLNIPKW